MRIVDPRLPQATTVTAGLIVALLAGPVATRAADSEDAAASPAGPIVTDRPTDSAAPQLVPRGTWQVELGYKLSRLAGDSGGTDAQELPDLLLRFGRADL